MLIETIKSLGKFLTLFIIYTLIIGITNNLTKNIYLSLLIPSLSIIFISILLNKKELKSSLKTFKKDFNIKIFIIGFIACLTSILINYILTRFVGTTSTNQSTIISYIDKYKYPFIFLIVFINPLQEEFLYRLPYSNSKNIISFIISSFIFASLHLTSINDLIYFIAYLIPTIGLTLNYFKTKNIYISYLLHALNNLINVLLLIW